MCGIRKASQKMVTATMVVAASQTREDRESVKKKEKRKGKHDQVEKRKINVKICIVNGCAL